MSAAKPTATHPEVHPAKGLAALAFKELMGGFAPSLNGWPGNQGTRQPLACLRARAGRWVKYRENSGRDDKPGKTGTNNRGVAQLVERWVHTPKGACSIHASATNHSRLSLRARITTSSSSIFSAMQFSSIHCTRDLAHSSLPAHVSSPCSAGLWPAGCVSPAGFLSSNSRDLSMRKIFA